MDQMKSQYKILKKLIPVRVKDFLKSGMDFLFYHLAKKKTIVIILSSMRSGSTLLKALLAQAADVSHLPEVDYRRYYTNKYGFYRKIYRLSQKRIIVLKYPVWYSDATSVRVIPDLKEIKVIILVRDCFGVMRSLGIRGLENKEIERSLDEYAAYWADTYSMLLKSVENEKSRTMTVRYEDLLENPIELTRKMFAFIGSACQKGVDTYDEPDTFEWKWGSDDGGEVIRTLKVQKDRADYDQYKLQTGEKTELSELAIELRKEFNYS